MIGLIKAYEEEEPGRESPIRETLQASGRHRLMSSQDPNDQALYSSTVDWLAPTINPNWSNQFPSNVSTNNQGKVVINDSDHSYEAATILNSDGTVNNPRCASMIGRT